MHGKTFRLEDFVVLEQSVVLSIVLMDELDQLVTPKQDIIYNFFNWPNLHNSRLIVIAVANTHDLPERVMSGKVRSRLGELIPDMDWLKSYFLFRHASNKLPSVYKGPTS